MSNKIKVEDILKRHCTTTTLYSVNKEIDGYSCQEDNVIAAIKEIVEAVIDKCVEEAKTRLETYSSPHESEWDYKIDRNSILNVKKMIDYE